DVPSTIPTPSLHGHAAGYAPDPLALLTHLATAILRVSSLHHAIEARRAKERSLPEPEWGLREGREGREGVLVGLRSLRGTGKKGVGYGGKDGGGGDVVGGE